MREINKNLPRLIWDLKKKIKLHITLNSKSLLTKYNKKLTDEENKSSILQAQIEFYKKYKNWIDKNRTFYQVNKEILDPWLHKSRNQPLWLGAVRKMEWQTGKN